MYVQPKVIRVIPVTQFLSMASERARAKRTNLVASRVHWNQMDPPEFITAQDQQAHGNWSQDSVRKWLTTTVTEEDAKREPACKAAEPLRRNSVGDDDLALGVEASLYGSQRVRTVQEFLRWSTSSPALSRWSSFSSATSGHSRPHSVMDILNLWNDDPEEVLLDLGFGCDEPDLSGRIPARFINHQSQARGINLQVFLEAQKNRLDLENPDVSNRFRQLEVLQQVTTAFSSLVRSSSSSPLRAPLGKALSPEAQERRRRMGILFRRASKKSLSQIHNHKTQDLTTPAATYSPCAAPESLQPPFNLGDKNFPSKRDKPGLLETGCLSPLAEEKGAGPDPQPQPNVAPLVDQEGALSHRTLTEGQPLTANTFLLRKKSLGQARESFEIEEIHSFDESCVTGSYTGGAEHLAQGVIRSNSCQSDSSGFLEEPFIPPLFKHTSPGADLIKALSGLSGGSTDIQSNEKPASPSPSSPHTPASPLLSSSLTSSSVNKFLLVSPGPSPKPSLVFSPSPSPVLLCLPKSDRQISETETPPDQDQSPPASLSALVCEYLPPCSSSTELQSVTHSQDLTLHSPFVFTALSPTSFPMQPEEIKTEDKDTPSPNLSALIHDSEGTACSTCSSVPPPVSSPFPSPNLDCLFSLSIATSSTQSDSSSGSPGNSQSEQSEVASHGNSLCAFFGLSSPLPSSPSAPPDFHCPASLASPLLNEPLPQNPENNHKDYLLQDSDGICLSDSSINPHKAGEETPSSLSFHASTSSSLALVSSEFEEHCPTLPCLPPNPSFPVCQSALPSLSQNVEGLIDPAAGGISDLSKQSICQHDDIIDPSLTPPVQDIIHVKMNHLSLDLKDTTQRNEKGAAAGEKHSDTVQTQKTVYISDTESSADLSEGCRLVSEEICNQTEIDPQLLSCSLPDKLSTGTQPEQCQREVNGSENESQRSSLVLHDDVPEADSGTEVEPKDLIKIESLDRIFQTSVDSSESETGDVDAFFQQLDTEGRAYWAEPIQVSNPSPVLEESVSVETSDGSPGNSQLPGGPAVLDSLPSTGRAMLLSPSSSTTMDTDQMSGNTIGCSDTPSSLTLAPFPSPSAIPDIKTSSRSVSVQMSSSLSSHIVQRKDVPYITDSKCTIQPSVLPLDTSTPFRAVQSWTDLQIQRNPLTKKLHGALHTAPKDITLSNGATETTQGPMLNFSSSPSFPLLSNDWQSHHCLPEKIKHQRTMSVSVDKELWLDEEEEVDGNGNEEEGKLWKEDQIATMACCCSCDRQCTCLTQKRNNIPYSLDELEEMMLCLQQFCSVLSNMEEQLSEDQAAVYSALSDQDREMIRDIDELRRAVKQEAGELEMQLNELADHYDDNLKMKMHRLLDEQSLLCSQLKFFRHGSGPTSSSPAPNRTVATQCCLLPWIHPAEEQRGPAFSWSTWNVDSLSQSPAGSKCICEGPGCSPTKADKLDMMSFLQRLKESLHHSVNTDS
ncbi:serine-rich adhesin for platelets [Cebidichthys violaceus]|uniref:serine-rich adhesin for platelets n=1 Tax=Cebidichthys violaceus TaxID=271503 RepID=UPI0035CB100E